MRYALIDCETTGLNPLKDKLIEVAVVIIEEWQIVKTWQSLIDPQTNIPKTIQGLTGISQIQVSEAPSFTEIANELACILNGECVIAHNARFDYAFLKNAFKQCDIDFNARVVCSIKLARHFLPQLKSHRLEALACHCGLEQESLHRAMSDVMILYKVLLTIRQKHTSALDGLINKLSKSASIPSLLETNIEDIPNTPGVYLFYANNSEIPIYIGKSIHLKERVLSHFNASNRNAKELTLAQQVTKIKWQQTSGELGALLLESQLIKNYLPIYNRRLRRVKQHWSWVLKQGKYHSLSIEKASHEVTSYGNFKSQFQAKKALSTLVKEHQLCMKLCGLELTKKGCFNLQLKRCLGACVGQESPENYNKRLLSALQQKQNCTWPYPGKIAIKELNDFHVFDNWHYLASVDELDKASALSIPEFFDNDAYKILKKYLTQLSEQDVILLN